MHRSILRLGFAIAATMAVCTAAYASTETIVTSGPGWGNVIVIGHYDFDRAFTIAPLALFKEQPSCVTQRGYNVTKPIAIKTRVAGAAVLATTQAGWRSGRLRKLSG